MAVSSVRAAARGGLSAVPVPINWHSGLPVYASEAFLKSVGDEYGWIGGFDESGDLRCILPFTVIRKLGVRLVRFRVETIPFGKELDEATEKSFLNSVVEHFRSNGADMIIPGHAAALFRTYPDQAVVAPYATFIKDLNQPEEILFKEVHADYRKKIRAAMKAGVQIKDGMQYLDAAFDLVADTLRRSGAEGLVRTHNEFRESILSLKENVRIFIADYHGAVQACLVTPFSEYSAYTYYGGTVPEPVKGAMHLVHWEAIRQFREMGVKRFNFQGVRVNPERGSKQEGIRTFKERFDGKLLQGYVWKYPFNRLKCAAYSIAARLILGGDFVDVERRRLAHSSGVKASAGVRTSPLLRGPAERRDRSRHRGEVRGASA
jgi:hypothetical protein